MNNSFNLKRGYITFKRDISSNVNIRFTQDVAVDQQGDGEGGIELRLKYAYVNVKTGSWGTFTDSNIEFGVVHRPWIDYEQKINDYRAQGQCSWMKTDLSVLRITEQHFSHCLEEKLMKSTRKK